MFKIIKGILEGFLLVQNLPSLLTVACPRYQANVVNPKIKPNKFQNGGLFSNLQH